MCARRMSRVRLFEFTALIGSCFAPLALTSASEAATSKSITISGSISGISGGQVLVLSAQGVVWTGVIQGRSFRVRVPSKDRAQLRDATVQVVATSGSYIGPVVLKRMAEKKNPACGRSTKPACIDDVVGLGRVTRNLSLGRLVAKDFQGAIPTWFLASKAPNIDRRDAVRAATRSGRPYGAGNLGLVPGGIPAVSVSSVNVKVTPSVKSSNDVMSATAQPTTVLVSSPLGGKWLPLPSDARTPANSSGLDHANVVSHGPAPGGDANPASGTISESCPTTTDPLANSVATKGTMAGSAPGQELDCSGVPNFLNVDVNGNDVLNIADKTPASIAASVITIGATILTAQQNAVSYYAGMTPTSLANFLIPELFPHQNPATFDLSATANQLFPGDTGSDVAMRVDCGSLAWCTNASLFNQLTAKPAGLWSQASPPYSLALDPVITKPTFEALLLPTYGTNIPIAITPGQVLTLNGTQTSSGTTAQTKMEIGPYFASTPYIAGATLGGPGSAGPGYLVTDSAGNALSASHTGTVTLKIQRPERLPLPGESPLSGVMDMSALNYWVSISNSSPPGPTASCPTAAYTNVSGATIASQPNQYGTYPLVDNTSRDFDPAAANNPGPIQLAVNLNACEANGGTGYSWVPGEHYQVAVSARGAIGSDVTTTTFEIIAPS